MGANFNPDAYIGDFDPEAYAAPAKAKPSTWAAIGRASVQGPTLGFGDEINAATQALAEGAPTSMEPLSALQSLAEATSGVPEAQRRGGAAVDAERAASMTPGERLQRGVEQFRLNRDADRAGNKAAKEAHPWAYGVTDFVTGIPAAFAMPGGQAKGIGRLAAAGALQGGVAGAGGSEADLTKGDLGGLALDTGIGAGAGAALGAGMGLLGRALRPALSRGAELLERLGITQGRKVLTGGTKSISQAAAVSDPAVERALQEGAIKPLGTTAGAAERLGVLREGAGQEYANVVKALEDAGVEGPSAHKIAAEWFLQAQAKEARSLGSPVPGLLRDRATELAGKVAPGDRLNLTVAEDMKRSLQDAARAEYQKLGHNEQGQALMGVASDMRQAVEDAIAQQAQKAPREAAAFEPVKKRLAELIQGSNAAEKALNAAKNKNAISLRDLLVAGAGKDPAQKLALLPLSMAARAVGPSTVAAGSYGAGQALRSLAAKSLSPASKDVLTAAQRSALAAYLESP